MDIHPSVFIAPTATVTGDVTMAENSSAWFGAVLRADDEPIHIGEGTNIQDNAVLHVDKGFPCRVGRRCIVGHGAIIHGAIIDDECLIGMGSVILNGARIGELSIVAAGAVVPEGMQVPPRSLVAGVPAKVRRHTTAEDWARIWSGAQNYVERAMQYKKGVMD